MNRSLTACFSDSIVFAREFLRQDRNARKEREFPLMVSWRTIASIKFEIPCIPRKNGVVAFFHPALELHP